jgi:hypothetical protein
MPSALIYMSSAQACIQMNHHQPHPGGPIKFKIQFNLPLPKVSRCRDNLKIMLPRGSLFDPDAFA